MRARKYIDSLLVNVGIVDGVCQSQIGQLADPRLITREIRERRLGIRRIDAQWRQAQAAQHQQQDT